MGAVTEVPFSISAPPAPNRPTPSDTLISTLTVAPLISAVFIPLGVHGIFGSVISTGEQLQLLGSLKFPDEPPTQVALLICAWPSNAQRQLSRITNTENQRRLED